MLHKKQGASWVFKIYQRVTFILINIMDITRCEIQKTYFFSAMSG
jgi:hypothetical protein